MQRRGAEQTKCLADHEAFACGIVARPQAVGNDKAAMHATMGWDMSACVEEGDAFTEGGVIMLTCHLCCSNCTCAVGDVCQALLAATRDT